MKSADVIRSVPVAAKELWNAWFFDDEFQHELFKVFRIVIEDVELDRTGEWPDLKIHRTLYFDTDRDIPKPLLKLVRGATRVHETLDFDAANKVMKVSLRVPVIGKFVDYGYIYAWKDEGDSAMEINWKGHCDVRIPLIRGLAEKYLLGELRDATEEGADFVQKWFGGVEDAADDGG